MISGTYLVLYLVKWEWMNDHCRENYILAYMVTSLINMSVELIPWWETWYLNLYGCKFGKMNVVKLLWRENKILAYMLRSLNLCLDVPWCETWYVNLFGFVFGIMNVFKLTLSRKWDFGLYAYKFDKWEGWICPLI